MFPQSMPQERRSHKEKERRKDKERHERDKASSMWPYVALQNALLHACFFCQPLLIGSEKFTRSVEGLRVSHHAPAEIEANQVEEKEGGATVTVHFKGCILAQSQVLGDVFFLSLFLLLPVFKKRIDEIICIDCLEL